MQRTLVLLKPDCVQRRLIGTIITRFEDKSLNIIAMKLMNVTAEMSKKHYAEPSRNRSILDWKSSSRERLSLP